MPVCPPLSFRGRRSTGRSPEFGLGSVVASAGVIFDLEPVGSLATICQITISNLDTVIARVIDSDCVARFRFRLFLSHEFGSDCQTQPLDETC